MKKGCRLFMTTIVPGNEINDKSAEVIHDVLSLFSTKKSSKTVICNDERNENMNWNSAEKKNKEVNENVLQKRKKRFIFF